MSYRLYTNSLNPLNSWRLGESSGTNAVDETSSSDGTYSGGYTLGSSSLLVGDSNTSVSLDGTDGHINSNMTIPANATMSVSCLFSVDSLANHVTLFGDMNAAGSSATSRVLLQLRDTGYWFVSIGDGTSLWFDLTTELHGLSAGTTYHLVYVIDNTNVKIYIDGTLSASYTSTVALGTAGTQDWKIGALGDVTGSGFFDGDMDEVDLYGTALSQAEVSELYRQSTAPGFPITAAGTFSSIVGDAALTLINPHTITAIGTFSSIVGDAALTVINPHTATATGVFSPVVGSAQLNITYQPISVTAAGTFSSIVGSASLTITIPPVSIAAAGVFSSLVGASYVYNPAVNALILLVGGVAISPGVIHGVIEVARGENESTVMSVTMISVPGPQDISHWIGKNVILDVDGTRIFTGVVNMPELDIVNKKITLSCTDDRNKKVNELPTATIEAIGFYSESIFNKTANNIEELEQRLTTIPSTVDFDSYGNYSITDINPKSSPDISLSGSDIYNKSVEVSITSAQRVINNVTLTFDDRFTRLRHRERGFKIEDLSFCDILDLGPTGSFTMKDTFIGYSDMMDWMVNPASIIWEEMPNSTASTAPPCTVDVAYLHDPRFATSMTYSAANRFAQTITEQYEITIKAPQSINQYGIINWDQENGHEVEYDASVWEGDDGYKPPTGLTASANDYYEDQAGSQADFENAILTAINIAKTKIITSHRDTQISFETPLRTDIDLTKTIEISSSVVSAKGKVTAISHYFDIANRYNKSKIEISLSTAQGTQTPDAITAPSRQVAPVLADAWTDPIVMLIVDDDVITPEIDATSRDEQISTSQSTYNIEIQNDDFQVQF